jgi:Pyruvate/2-oxoacid:ferredoxin oxidoreductase delta subunit
MTHYLVVGMVAQTGVGVAVQKVDSPVNLEAVAVEVAETMTAAVTESLAAAHQTQTQKRPAESLNCQCCQVYCPVQFQKQELQYTQHMRSLIFNVTM